MSAETKRRILIAVPTYNESGNIFPLVEGALEFVPEIEILFIDDHSRDNTQSEIAEAARRWPGKIHLLARAGKLGLGTAYVAAFKWALDRHYDAVIEMDADGSHRAFDLAKLVRALEEHPVVIGSRYIKGGGTQNWDFRRKLISYCGSLYARVILGVPIRDLTGGFNAWRSEVLRKVKPDSIRSEGYTFQIELKYRAHLAGYSSIEKPILFVERRVGQSKMSGKIFIEAIFRVWLLALSRKKILADMSQSRISE